MSDRPGACKDADARASWLGLFVPGMELSNDVVNLLMQRYSDSAIMPYLSLNGFIPFMIRMDRMLSKCHGNNNDAGFVFL